MTTNAKIILDIINNNNKHFTAEEIFIYLKNNDSRMSFATVYNNLNKLYNDNLIHKVVMEGKPDQYDKIIRHDHLYCKECGKVVDVELKDLTEELEKQLGIDIISYDLRINIVCEDCKKKNNN